MFDKMITAISSKIVDYAFFSDVTVNPKEKEICSYGIEILVSSIIGTIIIVTIGTALGMLPETLVYLAIFIVLRQYTGGLHLDTYTKCNVSSCLLFIGIMFLYKFLSEMFSIYVLSLCVFLSVSVIIMNCPVENKNKPITEAERAKLKFKAVILSVLCGIAGIILTIFGNNIGVLIILVLAEVSLLAETAIILKRRDKSEEDQCKDSYKENSSQSSTECF